MNRRCLMILTMCLQFACAGSPPASAVDTDDDVVFESAPALQMYLVLTENAKAMQGERAVRDMWTAVHGERKDFRFVQDWVAKTTVPRDYKVDIELDFATLPHSMLPARMLEPILRELTAKQRAKAARATLAVSFRSRNHTLPAANHLRLVGAAALRAAERYDGIVVDLLSRRAYTANAFRTHLMSSRLPGEVTTIKRRPLKDGRHLVISRGQIKLGLPDFVIGPLTPDEQRSLDMLLAMLRRDISSEQAQLGMVRQIAGESWRYVSCPKLGFDGRCIHLRRAARSR